MRRKFRCLHMTDVEKSEILHIWHVCDVENVAIYAKFMQFIAIYAVLLLNLLFALFCREIFATIYALSCGEKLSPKVHLWRKMTIIRSDNGFGFTIFMTFLCSFIYFYALYILYILFSSFQLLTQCIRLVREAICIQRRPLRPQ